MKKILLLSYLLILTLSANASNSIPDKFYGKWAHDDEVIEISRNNSVKHYTDGVIDKKGTFAFERSTWGNSIYFMEIQWSWIKNPNHEVYEEWEELVVDFADVSIGYEGSEVDLIRLPDYIQDVSDLGAGAFISHYEESYRVGLRSRLKYYWIYGEWKIPDGHRTGKTYYVKINPSSYQEAKNYETFAEIKWSKLPSQSSMITFGYHELLDDYVCHIDDLCFDDVDKRIYITHLGSKIYLEQTKKTVTTPIIIVFWVLVGLFSIGAAWALFCLGKVLLRCAVVALEKIKGWIEKFVIWIKDLYVNHRIRLVVMICGIIIIPSFAYLLSTSRVQHVLREVKTSISNTDSGDYEPSTREMEAEVENKPETKIERYRKKYNEYSRKYDEAMRKAQNSMDHRAREKYFQDAEYYNSKLEYLREQCMLETGYMMR